MRYLFIGVLTFSLGIFFTACEDGAPGGTCSPQCSEAGEALMDLCDYEDIEAELYFNGCTAYTIADDVEMCLESVEETECILEATNCEEATICQ